MDAAGIVSVQVYWLIPLAAALPPRHQFGSLVQLHQGAPDVGFFPQQST